MAFQCNMKAKLHVFIDSEVPTTPDVATTYTNQKDVVKDYKVAAAAAPNTVSTEKFNF